MYTHFALTCYHCIYCLDLLQKVLSSSREKVNEEPTSAAKTAKRKASPARAKEPAEPEYTKEQLELVQKIKK